MRTLLVIACAAALPMGCGSPGTPEEVHETFVLSDKMLSTTTTAEATLQQVKSELNLYGKITPDNNNMIEVYPVVGGYVSRVYVELGDYVKKGQLLASIRSTEVAGFEQELEDALNDVVVSKNKVKVAEELYAGKLTAENEVLEAKSHLEKAKSRLHRIQETYKIYNIKSGANFEIRSPLNGFIVQKKINQDMLLRNDRSDNIFDIAQINNVWAIANVNESDINQVKLGIDAAVSTNSYPDKKFYGKVDKIFNIIDPETKAMKVRIKLANDDYLLKPEMRATIKLFYTEDTALVAIPSEAVIFDKSKYHVMIFKDRNNIYTRQIEIYRQVAGTTYVTSGIEPGEQVITQNQLLIYDALND